MRQLYIDIETYYDEKVSLKKFCTWQYILHPESFIHTLIWAVDDGEINILILPDARTDYHGYRSTLIDTLTNIGYAAPDTITYAHNGMFDFTYIRYVTGLFPQYPLCTLLMDTYFKGTGTQKLIGGTARAYQHNQGLEDVYHTLNGSGHVARMLKDRGGLINVIAKHPYELSEAEAQVYGDYCVGDVEKLRFIAKTYAPHLPRVRRYAIGWALGAMAVPYLEFNADKAQEAAEGALQQMNAQLQAMGIHLSDLRSARTFGDLVNTYYPDGWPTKEVKRGKKKVLEPLMSKADPRWQAIYTSVNTPQVVKLIMELRGAVTRNSRDKRIERYCSIARSLNGRFPVHLIPSGAHTHRLTGGSGAGGNALNMPAGGIIRQCLHSPLGYKLSVSDFVGIELRVSRWMSRDQNSIDAVLSGRDMYRELAGWALNKAPEDCTSAERKMGKIGELSCQFGTGHTRLAATLGIDETLAKRFVQHFRKVMHPSLPKAWQVCDYIIGCWVAKQAPKMDRVRSALNLPEKTVITSDGRVIWPSGVTLFYNNMAYGIDGNAHYQPRGRGSDKFIYGSLLFENLVQSLANEIMWDKQYALSRAGFLVVMQVYDEVICVLPADNNLQSRRASIKQILSSPVDWWDLKHQPPLDIEQQIVITYDDAKD